MYSAGVCPRLTWPLLIQEFPMTWAEKELDSITTRYLKHWAGRSKSANTAILYLPRSVGGLAHAESGETGSVHRPQSGSSVGQCCAIFARRADEVCTECSSTTQC